MKTTFAFLISSAAAMCLGTKWPGNSGAPISTSGTSSTSLFGFNSGINEPLLGLNIDYSGSYDTSIISAGAMPVAFSEIKLWWNNSNTTTQFFSNK